MHVGIACAAGSYKGVFVHGVLDVFSEVNLKADIYAGASSTAAVTAYASIGKLALVNGPEHWSRMYSGYVKSNYDVSRAILEAMPECTEPLKEKLFGSDVPRFAVAVSEVVTREAQELAQGQGARRLGQQLVLATRSKDRSWAQANLKATLFETGSMNVRYRITKENLGEVLYATTRMLHAWKTPAWIDGSAYIDASYTCMCPAIELAELGCQDVIAISPEPGALYRDFFQSEEIPSSYGRSRIHVIKPKRNLAEIGVNYIKVTEKGLYEAYELGRQEGKLFLASWNDVESAITNRWS